MTYNDSGNDDNQRLMGDVEERIPLEFDDDLPSDDNPGIPRLHLYMKDYKCTKIAILVMDSLQLIFLGFMFALVSDEYVLSEGFMYVILAAVALIPFSALYGTIKYNSSWLVAPTGVYGWSVVTNGTLCITKTISSSSFVTQWDMFQLVAAFALFYPHYVFLHGLMDAEKRRDRNEYYCNRGEYTSVTTVET